MRRSTVSIGMLLLALTASGQQLSERGKFEISGKLVNVLTGEVIDNALVQVSPVTQPSQMRRSEVSSGGSFAFHDLPPGKYALMAQARNFPQQLFDQHQGFSTAIAVGPGKTSTGIVFRMRPQSSISGRVLDEHNEPVRAAQVMLFERNNDMGRRKVEMREQMQTDDRGEYHFHHLGAGTYYVVVSAQPWYRRYIQQYPGKGGDQQQENDSALDVAYSLTYYPNATESESASAIVLRPGDRISADFNLTPVQALHLTFRNAKPDRSQPVLPEIQPFAFGGPVNFSQPFLSRQQNGNDIQIYGVAPGDYTLQVPDYSDNNRTLRAQHLTVQQSGELDVSAMESVEPIHGTLKFDGERPPVNPFLQFEDLTSGQIIGTRVDDNGNFNIQPQRPGPYVVALVNAQGYAIRSISAAKGRVRGRTIEFTGNEPLELTMTASQGVGKVNGTVLRGDSSVSGAMVVLVPEDSANNVTLFRRDQSDSDGTFTLPDVVAGRYTVIALQNGWELEWASADALRPYLAHGAPVEIRGKEQLDIRVRVQ